MEQYNIFIPEEMSEPAYRFFREAGQLLLFIFSITDSAVNSEKITALLNTFLLTLDTQYQPPTKEFSRIDELRMHFEGGNNFNKYHKRMIMEVVISRMLDNYLVYLSELLGMIFIAKPETLAADTELKLSDVLEHSSTREELIKYVAEKKVASLSRFNIDGLSDFFNKNLKLKLSEQDSEMKSIKRISEIRNLIVHKRGIVDSHFKKRQPNYLGKIGDFLEFEDITVAQDIQLLCASVESLDNRGSCKFSLEQSMGKIKFNESNSLESTILESGIFFLHLLNLN